MQGCFFSGSFRLLGQKPCKAALSQIFQLHQYRTSALHHQLTELHPVPVKIIPAYASVPGFSFLGHNIVEKAFSVIKKQILILQKAQRLASSLKIRHLHLIQLLRSDHQAFGIFHHIHYT